MRAVAFTLAAIAIAALGAQAHGGATGEPAREDAAPAARDDRLAIAHGGIALIDPSGRNRRKLTGRRGWIDESPTWSPDARRIAFTRTTDGYRSRHIFVKPVAGGRARRLTNGRFADGADWSPDGRLIAYSGSGIKFVRPTGRRAGGVPGTRYYGSPAWSPDGRRLAIARHPWVVLIRRNGTGRRRLVRGGRPDWSPDGQQIVYQPPNGGVATIGVNGRGRRFLTNGMLPTWSPDGKRIAYQTWPDNNVFDTWVMNADGTGRRRVTRQGGYPDWRPLPR